MELEEILIQAQKLKFLGKPPVQEHILNAKGFIETIKKLNNNKPEGKLVDLGSGGGVPSLILIVPIIPALIMDFSKSAWMK